MQFRDFLLPIFVFSAPLVGAVCAAEAKPQTYTLYAGDYLGEVKAPDMPWGLWYPRPANDWNSALPVGNGHLGAMVFGGVARERLQINEHTVWNGKPTDYAKKGASKHLPALRQLLQDMRRDERKAKELSAAGDHEGAKKLHGQAMASQKAAHKLGLDEFMGEPLRQAAYQPCVDLWIESDVPKAVKNYRRWLDLDRAVATTEYEVDGTVLRREVFASHPENVLVTRIQSSRNGGLACRIGLSSPHKNLRHVPGADGVLSLNGEVEKDGIRFSCHIAMENRGGALERTPDGFRIAGADELVIRLVIGTSHVNFRDISADPEARARDLLAKAMAKSTDALLAGHIADHQQLFRRVSLDLGKTAAAELPTDLRVEKFSQGDDPALAALVFHYGRYLLIASSRPGGQPANLQGIWNEHMDPPWGSKYTCNINTQMNYWPALVANLAECQQPLFDAMPELQDSGTKTAREHYAADGWVLHHNFDLWRGTAPINNSDHGIWVTGGAWLCHHLWEHFLVTGDKKFLAEKAYPIMKEASRFFLGFLFEDPITGFLISGPSNSPEQGGLVMGPTMDHQIIRSLLQASASAAAILGTDAPLQKQWLATAERIAPNMVGKHGQLQEWTEDKDDPKNTHRHVSHLWGAYPGSDITWRDTKFFAAARQSLLYRGDAATGWSMGWKINLWARFLDGDHAYIIVGNLLKPSVGKETMKSGGGLYPNLFDAHPPFQIDGNFGYTAGIAEMLMQSHVVATKDADGMPEFLVHLLPALPSIWPQGQSRGLIARGGFELSLAWENGRLKNAEILSKRGSKLHLKYGEKSLVMDTQPGKSYQFGPDLAPLK